MTIPLEFDREHERQVMKDCLRELFRDAPEFREMFRMALKRDGEK